MGITGRDTHRIYFMFCVNWKRHPFHENLENQDKLPTGDSLVIVLPHIQTMHGEDHYVREIRIFVDTEERIAAPLVVGYARNLVFASACTRDCFIPVYVKVLKNK